MEGTETLVEQSKRGFIFCEELRALDFQNMCVGSSPFVGFLWGHIGLANFVKCTGVLLKGARPRFK